MYQNPNPLPSKSHTLKSTKYQFAHTQMIYTSSNISGDAIQAKHPPLTQSTNETMPFFTHPYPFTPHTHTPSDLYQ